MESSSQVEKYLDSFNIPLLSRRHGVSLRPVHVVVPGNRSDGEGGRDGGGQVGRGSILGSIGARRDRTLGAIIVSAKSNTCPQN